MNMFSSGGKNTENSHFTMENPPFESMYLPICKLGDVPFGHVSFLGMYNFLSIYEGKSSPLICHLIPQVPPFFLQR